MSRRARCAAPREAGFTLIALMASVAIMLILMGVGARSWSYVMKDTREEELIFRGGQIADAIQAYQQKNGNTPPVSLEVLVKGKYLRKLYKDPMTPKGEWRLIRQGEPITPVPGPSPSPGPSQGASPPPTTRPAGPGVPVGQSVGPIVGVASRNTEKGLRVFNGRRPYNEWYFVAGQPRVVGRMSVIPPLPGAGAPAPAPGQRGSPSAPR
jgi:type II secretory pathway pseudopilin PulG